MKLALRGILPTLIGFYSGAFCLWGGPQSHAISDSGECMQMVGHRGAAGLAPENTLAGFRMALELGVDGIELDVLLAADGEIMVHHNFALNAAIARIEGRYVQDSPPAVIGKMTFKEIRAYDVGRLNPFSFYGMRYPEQQPADGERIPALRDVISLLKERNDLKTRLWIEIKISPEEPEMTPSPEFVADAVIPLLEKEGFLSRVLILSFDWRTLVHVQKTVPAIPTVFLTRDSGKLDNIQRGKPGPSPWMAGLDIDDFNGSIPAAVSAAGGRHWAPHYKSLTLKKVEEAHSLGIQVSVWTPDSERDMLRLIRMKVDSIITNRPDILSKVLQRNP